MKEIYIRAKAVNGTYVYAPIGTADTYGTILIDNESLKYYNDTNGKTKLRVNGAALVDENTLTHYTDNDGKTKLKVNSAKLVGNDTLYAVDNKLYVNIALVSRLANDEIWRNLDNKLNKTALVQNIGYDSSRIMSQRAVTENLVKKLDKTEAKENFASLVNGKVPASQLPSYVDDVLEYDSKNDFPKPGETDKIYVDKSTNLTYRWSSNSNNYIMIGGGDLNLENGTGTGSLVQKTVSSSGTPYTNEASGSGAVAMGKKVNSKGNTTFVIGQENEAIAGTSGSFTSGYLNVNRGNYNIIGGENNANNNSWNLVIGKDNVVSNGGFGIISGLANTYDGPVAAENSSVSMLGNNLRVQYENHPSYGALLIGQFNKVENNSGRLFIVSNGTSSYDRRNAFEVLKDGRAKVYGEPNESNDVLRLNEFSVLTQSQVDLLF